MIGKQRRAGTADGWNHNSHYHDILLASIPQPCSRALDVGCGLGTFARRLATRVEHVDGIDQNVAVIQQASTLSRDITRIRFVEADFMAWTAVEPYDFISMIAVLHHLPFDHALAKASALLRPGGVLAVIGLHRARTLVHMSVRSLVGYPVSAFYRITRPTSRVGAPTRQPSMTLSEIRCGADALLPGVTIRRHVLWRYSMTWVKPLVTPGGGAIELRGEQSPSSSSRAPASSRGAMLA